MLNPKPFFFFLVLAFLFISNPVFAEGTATQCSKTLRSINLKKEFVGDLGGMWGLLEKSSALSKESVLGVQLDSKVNRLVAISTHLCETLRGIPLNDLAIYLTQNLKTKSKPAFKKELIILGWSANEIDEWFVFADFALKSENRGLNLAAVLQSLGRVDLALDKYKNLALDLKSSPDPGQLTTVKNLTQKLDALMVDDTLLAQGWKEMSAFPRWDLDGSTGGS